MMSLKSFTIPIIFICMAKSFFHLQYVYQTKIRKWQLLKIQQKSYETRSHKVEPSVDFKDLGLCSSPINRRTILGLCPKNDVNLRNECVRTFSLMED